MEPILRGHPDDRPSPLERPLDTLTINLNITVLISNPHERPPLLKGHFSGVKRVASQVPFSNEVHVALDRNLGPGHSSLPLQLIEGDL